MNPQNNGINPSQQGMPPMAGLPPMQPTADKDDLLERTAEQARSIMSHNAHDPYEQAKELEQLKAQYVYARYGRTLKVSDK